MISVESALNILKTNISPSNKSEVKPTLQAVNQILFEDISSPMNMPPFAQSAMDGYAVCLHKDLNYHVIDEVKAGDNHEPELKKGEAIRIFTGAPVPKTANAVIMQEKVQINDPLIKLESSIDIGDNIRPIGEQMKYGDVALKKGTKLTAASIGFLTSLGITEVNVYKKPSIAILVTGNELVKAGKKLNYGQIYESNAVMLQIVLNTLGYNEVITFKVDDDYNNTYNKLKDILNHHDVVLVSGGISVGDYDFVGKALLELNVNQLFYKVKQKPGKPLFFGKKEDTVVFALPGNPAASLSCFYIYVQTALQIMSGDVNFSLKRISAKSKSNFKNKGDRAQFLKAIYNNETVTILEGQSSSMLHTFALANALVYVPATKNEISIYEDIEVILLPIH
jgi:molybdopterin molybdotransferase